MSVDVPEGAAEAGRRLWLSAVEEFEFDEHELALLREAVRTVDTLDVLQTLVDRDGAVVSSPQGDKAHPAVVEARQQRITLARLLAALRMPAGDEDEDENRPQRRQGVRGVYGLREVS